ncbi:MAG: hypothetical protein Q8P38_02805 [Candidatus Nanopelagicales bacterium]|nr:hypothetical protein [Candidatus Nanopelagicales bacterium]
MRRHRTSTIAVVIAPLALAAALAGCGGGSSEPQTPSASPEQVEGASQLAMIRAHQLASLRLYEQDQAAKASKHAGHPAEEIFFSLSRSLRSQDAALTAELRTSLKESKDLVLAGAPVAELKASFEQGWKILGTAETVLVPDDIRNTAAFRGAVVANLLGIVGGEYEEAVVGGEMKMEIEYQDAWGALQVATERFDAERGDFGKDADEISEHLEVLGTYLLGVEPPANIVDSELVAQEVGAVRGDIDRAT